MSATSFPPSEASTPAASLAPPLSFATAHSPAPSTSSESAASTPVGGATTFPQLHHHGHLHYQQHQQQPQDLHHHQQQLHTSVMAHPRLHLNTSLVVDNDNHLYAHRQQRHNDGADRKGPSTGDDFLSPACSFEAYSHHFHLPLKTAAEKFGVRATAFKKRCRSIGIRHWPYRKVRSLRRSLQELHQCQEQGALNDKQRHQLANYTKQLDKLLSPETYGIDPSGRIPQQHFDDSEDESDDNESCGSSTQSPRYGVTFSDCNISPTDGDRTFSDFGLLTPPPPHMRTKHSIQYMQGTSYPRSTTPIFSPELHHHPLQRLPAPKDAPGLFYPKFSFGMFDPYVHEASGQANMAIGGGSRASEREDLINQPSSGMEPPHADFLPVSEDVRSLNEADDEFTDTAGPLDYTNERYFDDVFLHISPDYGCLV